MIETVARQCVLVRKDYIPGKPIDNSFPLTLFMNGVTPYPYGGDGGCTGKTGGADFSPPAAPAWARRSEAPLRRCGGHKNSS